jgi:hypothetical protein
VCPYGSTAAVKGAAVSTQGRLLRATIDRRFLCRPISFDTGSAAAVGRQGRWTQHLFAWLAEGGGRWKNSTATVARTERARREGEGAASHLCEEAHRGGDVRARHRAGGGSTVEETCARDSAQAADVRSQRAWCGGEGDCARKRAGSSAEEERICVEERAFRARWGAQGTRGGRRIRSALEWQGEAQTPN